MILFPNAKINIGLNILKKRNDGYHDITTMMYPIPLTDILDILKSTGTKHKKCSLTTTGLAINGNPEDNLVCKAYNLLDKEFELPPVTVHLHKSIPFGAGLGGGSSDGAFMLKGLNELFDLQLNNDRLAFFAAKLGSDCPFFIKNRPAIATARGEELSHQKLDLSEFFIVVIIPKMTISTREAYSLIKPASPKHSIEEYFHLPIESWKNKLVNDFEEPVYSLKPEIAGVKQKLYEAGAVYASLSGSGSSTYGLFRTEPNLKGVFPKDYFSWISKHDTHSRIK